MPRLLAPLLLLLALAPLAVAQDEEGSYDESEASSLAEPAFAEDDLAEELAEDAAAGASPVTYTVEEDTSSLHFKGEKLADVVAEIGRRKDKEAGSMFCSPFIKRQGGSDGKVTSCQLTVSCRMTLGQWDNYASRGSDAQAEWDRFSGALKTHEQGHLDVMKPFYDQVCPSILGKSKAESERIYRDLHGKAGAATRKHDADTNHGRRTGCEIDTSKDP